MSVREEHRKAIIDTFLQLFTREFRGENGTALFTPSFVSTVQLMAISPNYIAQRVSETTGLDIEAVDVASWCSKILEDDTI